MDSVASLPDKQRQELFVETAAAMKTVPAITEKDFWVVWVLGWAWLAEHGIDVEGI